MSDCPLCFGSGKTLISGDCPRCTPIGGDPAPTPQAVKGADLAPAALTPEGTDVLALWAQLHGQINNVVNWMLEDERLVDKASKLYGPIGGERALVELAAEFDKAIRAQADAPAPTRRAVGPIPEEIDVASDGSSERFADGSGGAKPDGGLSGAQGRGTPTDPPAASNAERDALRAERDEFKEASRLKAGWLLEARARAEAAEKDLADCRHVWNEAEQEAAGLTTMLAAAKKNLANALACLDTEAETLRRVDEAEAKLAAAQAEAGRYRQALSDIEAERQNLHDRIDDSQVAHWMCDAASAALSPGGSEAGGGEAGNGR